MTSAGMPTLQPAGLELRHAGFELQHPQVGDDHDRVVARDGAGIVVALDDVAGDRRDQRGITLDLAGAALRGLGLGEAGAGQLALGQRADLLRGLGGVEPLARQGALLEQVAGAIELEHRVGQRRLRRSRARPWRR